MSGEEISSSTRPPLQLKMLILKHPFYRLHLPSAHARELLRFSVLECISCSVRMTVDFSSQTIFLSKVNVQMNLFVAVLFP